MKRKPQLSHYLELILDQQRILIPLDYVHIVLFLPALQTVPDQDPAFEGMLNYHGMAISVFNLAKLIHATENKLIDLDTPLLLCDVKSVSLGLLVSEVLDVRIIDHNDIQSTSSDMMPYVVGIYEYQGVCAWLLDLDKLISHHQLELNHQVSYE